MTMVRVEADHLAAVAGADGLVEADLVADAKRVNQAVLHVGFQTRIKTDDPANVKGSKNHAVLIKSIVTAMELMCTPL